VITANLAIYLRRTTITCLLAIGVSRSWAAQPVSFVARHDYAVGPPCCSYANHVAIGDFNGDGIQDLAVTGWSMNAVFVLLGRGGGLFGPPNIAPMVNSPDKVVAADFNNDGLLDLAVSPYLESAVRILLGNGSGTFPTVLYLATPSFGSGMAVGDFNGDANQDLVTADFAPGTISVFMGNGNGTFGPPRTYPSGSYPASVAVGDFDRDGRPDIAAANETSHTISLFLGNGNGTFQPAAQYPAGADTFSVVMTDLNRDGNLDLVSANYSSNDVYVDFGSGTGGVNSTGSFAVGTHPWDVTADDLNGDGVPDLATADSSANTVSVLVSNGDGTCRPADSIVVGDGAYFSPSGVASGDLNGDGLPDLVAANGSLGTISVLINSTHGAVIGERVAWVDAVNATATGNSLRKTAGCDGCYDAWAVSDQQIAPGADYAEAEFIAGDATTFRVVGLTHAFAETTPAGIDFGIRLQAGVAEVRENGEYRASTLFFAGDSFRIAIQSGMLIYLKNGVPFYTRVATPTLPLFLAAVLADANASIDNVSMTGSSWKSSLRVDDHEIWWNALADAVGYDVVGGDLGALIRSRGDFSTSTNVCLANDSALVSLPYTRAPAAGQGSWFLVRGVYAYGSGTYDSGASSQVGSRDPGINASISACP
jgi:hypothetical protein